MAPYDAARRALGWLIQSKIVWLWVLTILAIHAGLLGWSAAWHAPTDDEVGHLSAGISHWHFARFDLYRVNPPLVRALAALPVVLSKPKVDWTLLAHPHWV
jgi:hypothetical protein